jgi:hypothetical protein
MRMRPTDSTLPFDEINEIAEENDVDFEDVVEIMTKYVLDRDKKDAEELKDNVLEVINTKFNGHAPDSFQEFYDVFNSYNWEPPYEAEEVKRVFDILTKDPNQLALFEAKKK